MDIQKLVIIVIVSDHWLIVIPEITTTFSEKIQLLFVSGHTPGYLLCCTSCEGGLDDIGNW